MVPSDTKNLMIELDGIIRNSKIWLNGEYLGGWPSARKHQDVHIGYHQTYNGYNLLIHLNQQSDSIMNVLFLVGSKSLMPSYCRRWHCVTLLWLNYR